MSTLERAVVIAASTVAVLFLYLSAITMKCR